MIKKISAQNTIYISENFENRSTGLRLEATPERMSTSFVNFIRSNNTWWIQISRELEFVDFSEIPIILSGLNLWLDAFDSFTISKGASDCVKQWNDKSGLDNHIYQSTAANQLTQSTSDCRANHQSSICSSTDVVMVGLDSTKNKNWQATMCEVIFTDATESLSYQQKIEGYLAWK